MGGGVMRSAAKPAVLAGHLLSAVASSSARAAATSIAAAAGQLAPSAVSAAGVVPSAPAVVQNEIVMPWEIDEWKSVSPPRLVFGPPPTIQETKEATADLKEALEIAYGFSHIVDESHGRTSVPHFEAKGCAADFGLAVFPSLPSSIKQAYESLLGSTKVQEAVASVAADRNVWDAVMKNPHVVQFCKNYQTNSVLELAAPASTRSSKTWKDMFSEYTTKIKKKLSEMVSNSSELLQSIFEYLPGSSSSPRTESTTAENENYKRSFVALVIAIIMVVLLKRV